MQTRSSYLRAVFFLFLLTCLLTGLVGTVRTPVQAASANVVISQVYGGGGNAGATYTNDFIELFNLSTTTTVSLNGWSVQYTTNNGTIWQTTPLTNVSIAPGQYYLIQEAAGVGGTIGLPTPDATGGIAMSATAGKVALVNSTTPLSGSGCPFDPSVVDFVGYGAGTTCSEGTSTPAPSNTMAIIRASSGCTETDNNSTDFITSAPTPRNTGSPVNNCPPPTSTPTSTNTPTNTFTPTPTFTPTNTPIFSLTPSLTPTPGEIIISEVAWSGTPASSDDEWIELYNTRATPVTLTGWRLVSDSGGLDIVLNGTIPANGFFLLERAFDNTVNDVGADQIYTGVLPDTGDVLRLRLPNGTVMDTANSNGGAWPGGTGSPNLYSMERVVIGGVPTTDGDSNWISSSNNALWTKHDAAGNLIHGTPVGNNWGFTVTATLVPTFTFTPTITFTPTRTATFTPTISATPAGFLSLVINEVAWAGTSASSSDEWIELYNPGTLPVVLTGWTLKALDGSPSIALAGTIPPGGYFLLERTDDTTVSDIIADQIYTGELSNSGETLQLFDPISRVIDTANSNGGSWPAGSSTTFGTMERRAVVADSDTAWITNTGVVSWGFDAGIPNTCTVTPPCTTAPKKLNGTPKHQNWAFTVTATPSPTRTVTPRPTSTRTPTLPPPPPLIAINEFVPRPGQDWNNDGQINIGDEYIEIINHGSVSVDLGGYSLDDEANIGSTPYRLPSKILLPGERMVYYGSDTGLLLSDGGDGVRLLKPNGQLADAYNYKVVRFPDQSYCRLPDNGGLDDWNINCSPTPGLPNKPGVNILNPSTGNTTALCPIADVLPFEFFLAECPSFGNIWNRFYWDVTGWFGELFLPNTDSQWEVYWD